MKLKRVSLLLWLLCALWGTAAAWGADFEYRGEIDPKDATSHLLAFYVQRFTPEELQLTVSDQPNAKGYFNDLYMDLTGVIIEKVRLDKLTFRMKGVQFNAPERWPAGDVVCENAIQIYALATILQEDINKSLDARTFGRDDHWRKLSLAITPKGLKARGYYALMGSMEILIEVDSGLKIVANKELWLKDPEVRINRLDLPDYITKRALNQIQPLLNLRRFPLPLSLHKVNLEEGKAHLLTRRLPEPIEQGISYHYISR